MRLDLYQAECEHVARLQAALLEQARTGSRRLGKRCPYRLTIPLPP